MKGGLRLGQKAAGLLREIEQDGVTVEDCRIAVDDRGNFPVGFDPQIVGRKLLALARINRNRLVRQGQLLEQQRDLHWVGREVEVELDHGDSLLELMASAV